MKLNLSKDSQTEQWLFYNIQFTANEHFVSIYFDI